MQAWAALNSSFSFSFAGYSTSVLIRETLPSTEEILELTGEIPVLMVTDTNTEKLTRGISGEEIPLLVLNPGEDSKNWDSIEKIISAARAASLGRDGFFIGVGGGAVTDLCAFAASIYKRGARLCLIPTTLLGMVDAALGGKTAINLLGLKNQAGTFFPAEHVLMPLEALDTLPEIQWKSGMAELIKTAVLDSGEFLELVKKLILLEKEGRQNPAFSLCLKECISRAVAYKGRIVEIDPRESGNERFLLNLGHTFGHALEAAAVPGTLSHGEAVAWGMVRACELGLALGITPLRRAREIKGILADYAYETRAPHPIVKSSEVLVEAMKSDKKRRAGKFRFIVPTEKSAKITDSDSILTEELIHSVLKGEYST